MAGFSKFVRPEMVDRGRISDRDLDIIEAILRYRFSPTSELLRLVGGNRNVHLAPFAPALGVGLYQPVRVSGDSHAQRVYYYLDTHQAAGLAATARARRRNLSADGRRDQAEPARPTTPARLSAAST